MSDSVQTPSKVMLQRRCVGTPAKGGARARGRFTPALGFLAVGQFALKNGKKTEPNPTNLT